MPWTLILTKILPQRKNVRKITETLRSHKNRAITFTGTNAVIVLISSSLFKQCGSEITPGSVLLELILSINYISDYIS